MNFTILLIVVEYIALTYIFGLLYKIIGEKSSAYIQRNFGWTGYCILGTIGVTYHELSHLITAVLFRHKINEVRLFRPFQGKVDGTLGYVNHSWERKSIYQKIGNFFIGTAPMFFGAGLLFIVLRVAYPSRFSNITEISEIPNLLIFAFSDAFTPTNLLTMWTPFVFLIVIFICPHMHMSRADVKGSASGAIVLTAAAFILSLATAVLPDDVVMQIKSAMNTFVAYYIYALILGLIISVIMALCFGSLSIIRGKR